MKKLQTTVSFVTQAAIRTFRNYSANPNRTNIQADVIFDLRLVADIAKGNVVGSANNTMFGV